MSDFFKARRAIEKQENEARMLRNMRVFFALNLQPPIVVEQHFSEKTLYFRVPGFKTIRFFLHKDRWRHGDVLYNGDLVDLLTWMQKRLDKSENP